MKISNQILIIADLGKVSKLKEEIAKQKRLKRRNWREKSKHFKILLK